MGCCWVIFLNKHHLEFRSSLWQWKWPGEGLTLIFRCSLTYIGCSFLSQAVHDVLEDGTPDLLQKSLWDLTTKLEPWGSGGICWPCWRDWAGLSSCLRCLIKYFSLLQFCYFFFITILYLQALLLSLEQGTGSNINWVFLLTKTRKKVGFTQKTPTVPRVYPTWSTCLQGQGVWEHNQQAKKWDCSLVMDIWPESSKSSSESILVASLWVEMILSS